MVLPQTKSTVHTLDIWFQYFPHFQWNFFETWLKVILPPPVPPNRMKNTLNGIWKASCAFCGGQIDWLMSPEGTFNFIYQCHSSVPFHMQLHFSTFFFRVRRVISCSTLMLHHYNNLAHRWQLMGAGQKGEAGLLTSKPCLFYSWWERCQLASQKEGPRWTQKPLWQKGVGAKSCCSDMVPWQSHGVVQSGQWVTTLSIAPQCCCGLGMRKGKGKVGASDVEPLPPLRRTSLELLAMWSSSFIWKHFLIPIYCCYCLIYFLHPVLFW